MDELICCFGRRWRGSGRRPMSDENGRRPTDDKRGVWGTWHGDACAGERLFLGVWGVFGNFGTAMPAPASACFGGVWVFLLRAYMYTRWLSSPVVYSPSGLSPTGLSSHTLGL